VKSIGPFNRAFRAAGGPTGIDALRSSGGPVGDPALPRRAAVGKPSPIA
jgi:hypothetical protein